MRTNALWIEIFNYLSDCKLHTMAEIAQELQISYSTVKRFINEISIILPISVTQGGRDTGGVRLLSNCFVNGKIIRNEDIEFLKEILKKFADDERAQRLLKLYT